MPPDTRLREAAEHILVTLTTALEARGIEVPMRRYVHVGQAAADFAGDRCVESFTVSWTGLFQGQIGFASGGALPAAEIDCAMPLSARYLVSLFRCVPVPKVGTAAPSVASLQASANSLMEDAMTLPAVIIDSALDGSLLDQHVEQVGIGNAASYGPQGGAGGVIVSLGVNIL